MLTLRLWHCPDLPRPSTLIARPPNGGVADSLDEAKAALRAAGERQRPLSTEKADEKCSA